MDSESPEDFVLLRNQLCFALYASSRMIVEAYAPILEPLGLTYEEYLVMMVLWEDGRLPEQELAETLRTDLREMAPWTDELEAKGLVRRDEAAEGTTIEPTESGRELRLKAVAAVPDAIRCRLLLGEDEIAGMREGLYRMMENLGQTRSN